jgi:hypothetical protein
MNINNKAISLKIKYSRVDAIRKLLFMLAQIKKLFYQRNNYFLLTDMTEKTFEDVVYMPQPLIDFLCEKFDWEGFDEDYWYEYYQEAEIPSEHKVFYEFVPEDVETDIFDEANLGESILIICNLFEILSLEVVVSITNVGTVGSFDTANFPDKISIFIREDVRTQDVFGSFVTALIRCKYPDREWEEYQSLQKFFLYQTKVNTLLNPKPYKKINSMKANLKEYDKFYNASLGNYKKLGFPVGESISMKGASILIDGYGKVDFLSPSEREVLEFLLKNKRKICTMDDIGTVLWGSDVDKYSLYAISKIIERLRKKLRNNGLNKNVIFTERGKGYICLP